MRNETTKRAALALGLVCLAVAGVTYASLELIRRDRGALVDQFAAQRLAQIDEITRELERDFAELGAALRHAGRLVEAARSPEELALSLDTFVALVPQCVLIEHYDAAGARLLSARSPTTPPSAASDAVDRAAAETVAAALADPRGGIEMSPPLPAVEGGWYRVFAAAIPGAGRPEGAVAALVDTGALFRKVRIVTAEPASQLLILGTRGRPTPATDPALAAVLENMEALRGEVPTYAALVSRMREGGRGGLRISGEEAARLGLGDSEVIVAYGPIPVDGGRWSAATLTSTAPLRTLERAVELRLGLASAVVSLCLAAFGGYVVYVSRREVAIRERLAHAERLAHLREKTEKILDNIPTGVVALSEDGRITAVNRALAPKLPAAAVGLALRDAFPAAPRAVAEHLQSLVGDARAAGREKSVFGERLPLFGEEGQYNLYAVPLEPRDPEARALLVIEDVSAVHLLEAQLLRTEKLATVGVLAAGIAHEVGTPLGVVRWRAEHILAKLGAEHPQAGGVGIIVEQIDHVTRIIRQLLDFARLRPALVRPVPLGEVTAAVAELLRYEGERRKVALKVAIPERLPALAADRDQLQQVLVNLVMNAYDACAAGGTVAVTAREDDAARDTLRRVRLEISDDGRGIPPEHRHQIFDPFFTTKKRGQGTGLGLTIAAQIVRDHGGEIELASAPGEGTRVAVLWPTAAGEARDGQTS